MGLEEASYDSLSHWLSTPPARGRRLITCMYVVMYVHLHGAKQSRLHSTGSNSPFSLFSFLFSFLVSLLSFSLVFLSASLRFRTHDFRCHHGPMQTNT